MDELLRKKVDETFEDVQHGDDASVVEPLRVDEHVCGMEVNGVEVRVRVRQGRVGDGSRAERRGQKGMSVRFAVSWISTEETGHGGCALFRRFNEKWWRQRKYTGEDRLGEVEHR